MREKANSVEEYFAAIDSDVARKALIHLREIIRSEVPDAQEVISYGIPTFKFAGQMVSYAAFKNHCSFFPGTVLAGFKEELSRYKTSTGTIQFDPLNPISESLVRSLIKARKGQGLAKKAAKTKK